MIRVMVHRMRKGGNKEHKVREIELANTALLDRIKDASDLTITHISDSMIVLESPHRLYGKGGIVGGGHTLRYRLFIGDSRSARSSFRNFRGKVYDYAVEHPELCTDQVRQAMRRAS